MLGYTDRVRIIRVTPGEGAAGSGWPAAGSESVLYDGFADVQNGAQTLAAIAEGAGDRVEANAAVFLPPSAAVAFSSVRVDDVVETPIGAGTVVRLRHTDAALDVRLTSSAAAVPTILAPAGAP